MRTRPKSSFPLTRRSIWLVASLFCLSLGACNRAAVRIPGASLSFPETPTRYVAQKTYPYNVAVAPPTDLRADHYGERVAGTRWTGCQTDALWGDQAPSIIQSRLVTELSASKVVANARPGEPAAGDLVIRSEIHAFCSQVVGFLYGRVAGIAALNIILERDGKVLFKQKLERVVTDADREYTGSQVGFIEQAMRVTMADSLRELIRDFLVRLERDAANWAG
jgi:ABC-type uncharacterized transport system auxiliary subunit